MRATSQVLYMLHARMDYSDVPLEVFMDTGKNHRYVKATQPVPSNKLFLPPCALKPKSLSSNSAHPSRVTIDVQVFKQNGSQCLSSVVSKPDTKRRRTAKEAAVADVDSTEAAVADSERRSSVDSQEAAVAGANSKEAAVAGGCEEPRSNALKSFKFYVNPEWKGPEADRVDPEMWSWHGDESMHPYWSIRRLSQQRLGEATFNMTRKDVAFTVLTLGAINGKSVSVTMEVTVPVLTNSVEIPNGAELLLEEEERQRKENQKAKTWKDDVHIRSRGGSGSGGLLAGATRKATKTVVNV